ncbi:MAG: hypothetical protein C5B54_00875 [Acidobacteria bacterium]|nr:MAG: hypothetical protein C5B54_00875 [Acidobacteriota bacterium]
MTLPGPDRECDLSISIVSFNTCDLLERTICAVLADTQELNAEIIVVDNASTDGSAAMVTKRFPCVTLITNSQNRFFTAAHNQAAALSRGRYVLILNSDVEIQAGTLPAMVHYLDTHKDVGLVTGRLFFPDGQIQQNCARFSSYTSMIFDYTFWGLFQRSRHQKMRRSTWYADWDRQTEREVDVAPGSFLMIRRELFITTGRFDESLRLYFAEDDLCWRIKQKGFKIMYIPIGGAIHPEGASVQQVPSLARRIYFGDMIRYAEKYFGMWRARWLWLLTRPTYWGITLKADLRNRAYR